MDPRRRRAQQGLTLVELLVVLVVMALIGAVAVATLPPPVTEAERAARRLAARVPGLVDEAIISARPLGLDADTDGLKVFTYEAEGWTPRAAEAMPHDLRLDLTPAEEVLPPDPPPTGTLLVYRPPGAREAEPAPPPPPVTVSPTGEVTPFVLEVEGRERWLVRVDASGEAEVTRDD